MYIFIEKKKNSCVKSIHPTNRFSKKPLCGSMLDFLRVKSIN